MPTEALHHPRREAHDGNTQPRGLKRPSNPLLAGILSYYSQNDPLTNRDLDICHLPKRFTLYGSLLLLPPNFAAHSPQWSKLYSSLNQHDNDALFAQVASAFSRSGKPVTHIAINAPIAPTTVTNSEMCTQNILRSPSRLSPVYGDFGPDGLQAGAAAPSQEDFDVALWVSTVQSAGITQVWAPRWTMFSRGNFSEKARILRLAGQKFPGMTEAELGCPLELAEVVDMYVGIGYFAFSYLKSGVKRVWGWDLNPWSVEGLRRGCERSGWRCIVVHQSEDGSMLGSDPAMLAQTIAQGDKAEGHAQVRCVVFQGDNRWTAELLQIIRMELANQGGVLSVRHINMGLLPSSQLSWVNAVKSIDGLGGWLHIHENVEARRIAARAAEIAKEIDKLLVKNKKGTWKSECQHIEQVKTYAPGVVHCVFDVRVAPSQE